MALVDQICETVWAGVRRFDESTTPAEVVNKDTRLFKFCDGLLSVRLTAADGVEYCIEGFTFSHKGVVRSEGECKSVVLGAWCFLFGAYLYSDLRDWCNDNSAYEMQLDYTSQTDSRVSFGIGPAAQYLWLSIWFVEGGRINYDIKYWKGDVSSGRRLEYVEARNCILSDLEAAKVTTNMVPKRFFGAQLSDIDARLGALMGRRL